METKNQEIQEFEELILTYLEKKYKINKEELKKTLENKKQETGIPIEILKHKELSPLEATTKYLRENQGKTYKEISQLLHKKTSTLAVTYKNSKQKKPRPITIQEQEIIPYTAIKPRQTILKSTIQHLKEKGLNHKEIAQKTGRNPRTIKNILNKK